MIRVIRSSSDMIDMPDCLNYPNPKPSTATDFVAAMATSFPTNQAIVVGGGLGGPWDNPTPKR